MNDTTLPDYYHDLNAVLPQVQAMLEEGASSRHVAAHAPVVASLDANGGPSQRVMILRECDWANQRLRFHTDTRSNKVAQLDTRDQMSVLIYDKEAKLQLRLTGTGWAEKGTNADLPWKSSTPFARRCYMAKAAPGSISDAPTSGLPEWIEGKKPEEDQLLDARANFSILMFAFDRIEWLYLANSGHRRAAFSFDHDSAVWSGDWLVP